MLHRSKVIDITSYPSFLVIVIQSLFYKKIFNQTRSYTEASSITCPTKLKHPISYVKVPQSGLLLS